MESNILCTLLNDVNARKIVQFYLFRCEESKIVEGKYLHYNKGAKIWILEDCSANHHVVKRYRAWPQTLISVLYPCSIPVDMQAALLLLSLIFSKIISP